MGGAGGGGGGGGGGGAGCGCVELMWRKRSNDVKYEPPAG